MYTRADLSPEFIDAFDSVYIYSQSYKYYEQGYVSILDLCTELFEKYGYGVETFTKRGIRKVRKYKADELNALFEGMKIQSLNSDGIWVLNKDCPAYYFGERRTRNAKQLRWGRALTLPVLKKFNELNDNTYFAVVAPK